MNLNKTYLLVFLILSGVLLTPIVMSQNQTDEIAQELVNIPYVERVEMLSSHVFSGIVKDTECKYVFENGVKTIKTYVAFDIKEQNKGNAPKEIIVVYEGGKIGEEGIMVMYNPGSVIDLEIGQEATIYANHNEKSNEYYTYYVQTKHINDDYNIIKQQEVLFTQPKHTLIPIPEIYNEGFAFDGIHFDITDHPNGYFINQYGTADITGTTNEFNAIKAAFNTWLNVADANVGFAYVTTTSNGLNLYDDTCVVDWQTYSSESWVGRTSIRYNTVTLQMYVWDIELNDYFTWSIGAVSNKYDVQSVVTHEAGHTLKLLDLFSESNAAKTMYWFAIPNSTYQRSLEPGDKAGAIYIYPD